ncbi:hypothetical protein [Simkania sp.]|uniref:hypothetical protein n=1 Tax=Simkania sp. TaxID=34094 RepID=UPI003B5169F8
MLSLRLSSKRSHYSKMPTQKEECVAFRERSPINMRTWSKLGRVGKVPPVPKSLLKKMKAPCPYWEGYLVEETSRLVLIPEKIERRRVSPKLLRDLTLKTHLHLSLGERVTRVFFVRDPYFAQYDNIKVQKPYWAIMTLLPIPGSSEVSWDRHAELLADGDRPPKIVELAAFFYGSYLMGETDLAHGQTSRCLEDGEMSLTSTLENVVEINYIDWKAGTVAVRL